jgi:ferric-dicitrate binding protein FerR (iron transport regulator)
VVDDPAKPFMVAAGAVQARVLGTRFNVSNYAADKRIAVTVLSGKVAVQDAPANQPVILGPHQEATYQGAAFTVSTVEDSANIAWTRGELVFHKTPLQQVVRILETRFNKKIVVNAALEQCVFYGDFTRETLPEILSSMAIALNGHARETNGAWYIDGKGCF